MVGERSLVQPFAPEARGLLHPRIRLFGGLRPAARGRPTERRERRLALARGRAGRRELALEADTQGAVQRQLHATAVGLAERLAVARTRVLPVAVLRRVVELRRALQVQVDQPLHAARDPNQAVLGLVVRRRAPVLLLALVL